MAGIMPAAADARVSLYLLSEMEAEAEARERERNNQSAKPL